MSRRASLTSAAVLFAALFLLRAQLFVEVGVPIPHALALGFVFGVLLDLASALFIVGLAIGIGARWPRTARISILALSTVVWGFSAANVAYFGYFDARLEPWVVVSHIRDLPAIAGSLQSMVGIPALLAGLVMMPVAFAAMVATRSRDSEPAVSAKLGVLGMIAALGVTVGATTVKHQMIDGNSILAEQLFVAWVEDGLGQLPNYTARQRVMEKTLREAASLDPAAPGRVLATFRDWDPRSAPLPDNTDVAAARPLVHELQRDRVRSRALRARLGLPADGPVHVVVLFLESVRAFEMEHSALWPEIFPRTRALLARHALRFPTAYASTPDVGKTVQGQFATLCSLLPNFGGAAAYTAHAHLRVMSLAEVARKNGYHTVWISGSTENFHNKRVFESLHGTDRFFDVDYLQRIPYEGTHPTCGYPDGPMLQEAVRILEREARDGRPVFANILTLSTHHPVSEIPEGPVPEALRAAASEWPAQPDYVGYLSRLRYLDESLEPFFTALFGSPLGDRTLVVLLGDHGQRYKPHLALAEYQVVELMARIPFAFVTKHMPAPGVIAHPVHQIDVAPTVADIVGFDGRVAWVGRNVIEGPGTPWVIAEKSRLHYRVQDRACYTLQGAAAPRCYRINDGIDPMLIADLPAVAPDPAQMRFFRSVAIAARQAITRNVVMPARNR